MVGSRLRERPKKKGGFGEDVMGHGRRDSKQEGGFSLGREGEIKKRV